MRQFARKKERDEDAQIENKRAYLDESGVCLRGNWEKGFPSWLIEEYGFRPYQRISIEDDPLLLVPEGEVKEIRGQGSPVRCYKITQASLERVWKKYGPPSPQKRFARPH